MQKTELGTDSISQLKNKHYKSMVSTNPQLLKEFINLLYYTAKVLAFFLKLFFLIIFSAVLQFA